MDLKSKIVNRVLSNINRTKILNYLGRDALSAISLFELDGYSSRLYTGLDLAEDDRVIVLGGYLGDSSGAWSNAFNSVIDVYEPIEDYFNSLQLRFSGREGITLHNVAVGDHEGCLDFYQFGERSSFYDSWNEGGHRVSVKQIDVASILDNPVALMEINIEGAEYSVMERIIDSKKVHLIGVIQIQFHKVGSDYAAKRNRIHNLLLETHDLEFNYEYVWERWVRR